MTRLVTLGVFLIVGVELLALIMHDRRFVLVAAGAALALVLLGGGTTYTLRADFLDAGGLVAGWFGLRALRAGRNRPEPAGLS